MGREKFSCLTVRFFAKIFLSTTCNRETKKAGSWMTTCEFTEIIGSLGLVRGIWYISKGHRDELLENMQMGYKNELSNTPISDCLPSSSCNGKVVGTCISFGQNNLNEVK